MASGSSARPSSGSKGFDFASGDVLCSYGDNGNQETSNGIHSDPSMGTISSKDFQKSRISRSAVVPTTNVYSQPEESLNQEVLSTVERTMKKYADNLMRFMEGISSRLSQLELYCYNLDKSIGQMRSDLDHDHGEADSKLKSMEKHLQEVHRSVQILKDKQELAETQNELSKLQLAQKHSSTTIHEERSVVSPSASEKTSDISNPPNTQFALAVSSQVGPHPSHPTMPQSQTLTQLPTYYLASTQFPNPQTQPSYLPTDAHYRAPQLVPQSGPQSSQTQVYQLVQSPQPPSMQPQNQIRAPTSQSSVFQYVTTSQPGNPPFSGIQQPGLSRAEAISYAYGGTIKTGFPSQVGDPYATGGSHPPLSSGGSYILYDCEGVPPHRPPQPTHYSQGGYAPANPGSPQQFSRKHPYNELIDKVVSMGYRSDHVGSVIQRLEESGQPVVFDVVLDRLNGHTSGGSQRGW